MNGMETENNLKKFSDVEHCPVRNVIACFSSKWAILIRHLAQGADRNAQGVGVARSRVARDLSRGSAAGRILAHPARPLVGRGVSASHAVGDGEFFGGDAEPMMPRVQSHSFCYCSIRRKSFYSPPSLCIIFFCE